MKEELLKKAIQGKIVKCWIQLRKVYGTYEV